MPEEHKFNGKRGFVEEGKSLDGRERTGPDARAPKWLLVSATSKDNNTFKRNFKHATPSLAFP